MDGISMKPTLLRADEGVISSTQKNNQFARGQIMGVLQSLGLPVIMDASHIVMTGIDEVVPWMLASNDESFKTLFGQGSEKYNKALATFERSMPAVSITHVSSPAISLRGGSIALDGVAMRVRLAKGNANEGPEGFIIPISKQMLRTGAEWTTHVALVPKSHMNMWIGMLGAAFEASRSLDASRMTLRVFNGPDIPIQPMALSDIIMDDSVKASFVDDLMGFLSRKSWYTERGLPWTRKYLLNGPPGTGKTSLARWAASKLGMPALSFDFTDRWADGRDFNRFMGYAKRMAPSLVILDDIDKIFSGQNLTSITTHTMLTSFSGMGNLDGVMVIATSNSTDPFRGPMRRRFDSVIEVGLPGLEHRVEYLTKLLNVDGVGERAILQASEQSSGWSFDDLRALVTSAANFVIKRRGAKIEGKDLQRAMHSVHERRQESLQDTRKQAFTTGQGGDDRHTHPIEKAGDTSTGSGGGGDEHVHSIPVGSAVSGTTNGHTHSIPAAARR